MAVTIQLKLFATLSRFNPDSADRYEISEGTTINDLLSRLEIPTEKAKLVFVNGIKADLSQTLKGEDRVGIFPPVGGG